MLLARVLQRVAEAAGSQGMVAGQAADLRYEAPLSSESQDPRSQIQLLERINQLKTGRLISVCVTAGATWVGAPESTVRRFDRLGKSIGSLYQLVDDIIDGQGFAQIAGANRAYRKAAQFRDAALKECRAFGRKAHLLEEFVRYLYERKD